METDTTVQFEPMKCKYKIWVRAVHTDGKRHPPEPSRMSECDISEFYEGELTHKDNDHQFTAEPVEQCYEIPCTHLKSKHNNAGFCLDCRDLWPHNEKATQHKFKPESEYEPYYPSYGRKFNAFDGYYDVK